MDPYLGEIRMTAGSVAPPGWAFCNGQLLPIDQNQALFSLLGNTFGGDNRTTFALPDLRGRVPMHRGQGRGFRHHPFGERGGETTHTLTIPELPHHMHVMQASRGPATTPHTKDTYLAGRRIWSPAQPTTKLAAGSMSSAGGGKPHDNVQPSLALNFCICINGIYPTRP